MRQVHHIRPQNPFLKDPSIINHLPFTDFPSLKDNTTSPNNTNPNLQTSPQNPSPNPPPNTPKTKTPTHHPTKSPTQIPTLILNPRPNYSMSRVPPCINIPMAITPRWDGALIHDPSTNYQLPGPCIDL